MRKNNTKKSKTKVEYTDNINETIYKNTSYGYKDN